MVSLFWSPTTSTIGGLKLAFFLMQALNQHLLLFHCCCFSYHSPWHLHLRYFQMLNEIAWNNVCLFSPAIAQQLEDLVPSYNVDDGVQIASFHMNHKYNPAGHH